MLDFTEKEASTTLLPELSADTQTVSDSLLAIRPSASLPTLMDILSDPDVTAATNAKLAPYRDGEYFQDETEPVEV